MYVDYLETPNVSSGTIFCNNHIFFSFFLFRRVLCIVVALLLKDLLVRKRHDRRVGPLLQALYEVELPPPPLGLPHAQTEGGDGDGLAKATKQVAITAAAAATTTTTTTTTTTRTSNYNATIPNHEGFGIASDP